MVRTVVPSVRSRLGESPVEIGGAEALLGEQGPGLGAVGRVEPVARLFEQAVHVGAPALSRPPATSR